MKRGRKSDTLTGGSNDVSPQYFTISSGTQTALNTYREGAIPTPVPRNKVQSGEVTVMEILKIYFDLAEPDTNNSAAGNVLQVQAQLATKSQIAIDPSQPTVFAWANKIIRGAFTAAGTYGTAYMEPLVWDATDGAGHGILVATDNIFFGINTVNFAGAFATASCKILYRMKNVSLAEYIGIVQSQQ